MRISLVASAALTLIAAAPATATTLYSTDFDGPATVDTGVTASGFDNGALNGATVGAWNAAGWTGNYFDARNGAGTLSTLTLTGLASHTTVSIGFLLGLLESWDSSDGCCGFAPDFLDVLVDGTPLLVGLTTDTALGSVEDYAGGTELFEGVQLNDVYDYYSDVLVDMNGIPALTFAHSASTLTLGFRAYGAGWQGGGDEGFGIDSLSISYDGAGATAVPEPAGWAMLIAGFGLVGAAMRRRRANLGFVTA